LINLGPEPLSADFTADYFQQQIKSRKTAIKNVLMDSHSVAGIGNIYAAEALFAAGIHPQLPAHQLSLARCEILVAAVREVLRAAILQGGTTLKDFSDANGHPGYFKVALKVYGRAGLPCVKCKNRLLSYQLAQRSTVYCAECQK
jgi:formamidopyrimidine-DNA glycosylase